MPTALAELFERIVIISLPSRADRRRAMVAQLGRIGLRLEPGRVEFFDAIRPDSAEGFPGVGARGCFLSHLEVLGRARDDRLANLLVFEDDLSFTRRMVDEQPAVVEALDAGRWDLAYLGYRLFEPPPAPEPARGVALAPFSGRIDTTHVYAIRGAAIGRLAECLDRIRRRPPGHPDGGPMQIDGGFNTFRRQNPDVTTVIALPQLGVQRSSRSDITAARWFDHLPVLRDLADAARSVRRALADRRDR